MGVPRQLLWSRGRRGDQQLMPSYSISSPLWCCCCCRCCRCCWSFISCISLEKGAVEQAKLCCRSSETLHLTAATGSHGAARRGWTRQVIDECKGAAAEQRCSLVLHLQIEPHSRQPWTQFSTQRSGWRDTYFTTACCALLDAPRALARNSLSREPPPHRGTGTKVAAHSDTDRAP